MIEVALLLLQFLRLGFQLIALFLDLLPGFHDLLSSGCDFLPFRQHTEAAGGAVLALDIGFQGLRDLLLGAHLSCPAMEPEETPVHTV